MSARTTSMIRIAGVALISLAVCVIGQRLVALSTAMSNIALTLASATTTRAPLPPGPSSAETARMRALSDRIGVITQNIANAQTTAFKRRRVDANSGLDAKLSDLPLDMTQGSLESTGINTDVAISGEGFLHVKVFPSSGDGTGYTRNGTLFKNAVGDLIVGIGGGYRLIPTINIPIGATDILIGQDGTVSYLAAGKNSRVRAGQIHISRFTNPQALSPLGGGIYSATALSGPVVSCIPGQSGAGVLMNGFLESSNVDPIRESVDLVEAEQSLQLSGQALETAIRARQTIAALDRR